MPAVIAAELIASSMRLMGALGAAETPTAEEVTQGLATLNDILEDWSIHGLAVHATVDQALVLTAGVGSYTAGPGGNLNGSRPVRITSAYLKQGGQDQALDLVDAAQWNGIADKAFRGWPELLNYNPTHPTGTLRLWPVPSDGMTLVVTSEQQLQQVASPAVQISLPPGYSRALRYALALELAIEYGEKVTDDLRATAAAALANIKRANSSPPVLRVDDALLGPHRGGLDGFMAGD